ncbi:MAG: class I SAM-dependent methyltransferase [Acidimicrobiia bacterium]
MRRAVLDYLRPRARERLLDIGCGPAEILEDLDPDVTYVGFDVSERYIEEARARFGQRGSFLAADVAALDPEVVGEFDIVLAHSVLHHISDEVAGKLFDLAARVLVPTGRLVTVDGCFEPGQSRLARFIISQDRGEAVRTPEGYRKLAERSFGRVDVHIHNELLRIPYTLAILDCGLPKRM